MSSCPGAGSAGIQSVHSETVMAFEDGRWRGRPASTDAGTFDIEFVPGPRGPAAPGDRSDGIVGTGSGVVRSIVIPGSLAPVSDSQVTLGGTTPATLNGGVSDGVVASGLISGIVVFSNSRDTIVPCSSGTVHWFMSRRGS
jgi:hypothetical protein